MCMPSPPPHSETPLVLPESSSSAVAPVPHPHNLLPLQPIPFCFSHFHHLTPSTLSPFGWFLSAFPGSPGAWPSSPLLIFDHISLLYALPSLHLSYEISKAAALKKKWKIDIVEMWGLHLVVTFHYSEQIPPLHLHPPPSLHNSGSSPWKQWDKEVCVLALTGEHVHTHTHTRTQTHTTTINW